MRIVAAGLVLNVFLLTFSSSASGQSAVVQVTAAESGDPLPGVFVSLLDLEGRVVRSGLSNEAGRLVFPLPGQNSFRVKAELIGRETRTSGTVAPGERDSVAVSLALSLNAFTLDAIRADGARRCRLRPDEASEIIQLWEEVRKALTVQAWSERERLYRLDVSTYERDLDDAARRVERESRRGTSRVTRVPFASLPARELTRGGFVRQLSDGGWDYYGPDAALLLSDDFLDTHCFSITRSLDHQGAVGLAFEPVRAGEFPDIRGTLWVDEVTAALRLLEFRYTQLPYPEAEGIAGGRVEFERLPDGAWMIQKWRIRAPILVRHHNLARAGDTGIRVAGIRETGGEVLGVSTLERRRITQVRRGSLRGVVWDSTRAVPLAGAAVSLSGTAFAGRSDSAGRFVIGDLPAGIFTVVFEHPRLDSLGILPPAAEAEIIGGRASHLDLAVPSTAAILLAACREEAETPGAVLSGIVSDRTRGTPIPGASVRVEWQQVERMRPTVRATDQWFEVLTDENGRYTACTIPIDETVRIRASLLTYRSDPAEVEFAETGHRSLDLTIDLPAAVAGARGVSGRAMESGVQGVQGIVRERGAGSRVQDAAITLRRLTGEVVASGATNERGAFRLNTPAPGRYLLSVETLGYGPLDGEVVDVSDGMVTVLEIQMAPEAVALEPLVATAEPRVHRLEVDGFYRRMETGLGKFFTPEVFEERKPRMASDLLFGIPGVNVADPSTGVGGRAVYFRSGIRASGVCWPMIYVDRQLVSNGGQAATGAEPAALDEAVRAPDVWAMEVYRSAVEVPPEFNGANAGCGVIVLWTRRSGG